MLGSLLQCLATQAMLVTPVFPASLSCSRCCWWPLVFPYVTFFPVSQQQKDFACECWLACSSWHHDQWQEYWWCVIVSSKLQHDLYMVRHEREMSTVQEIHAVLQAHVQLLDQVSQLSTATLHVRALQVSHWSGERIDAKRSVVECQPLSENWPFFNHFMEGTLLLSFLPSNTGYRDFWVMSVTSL